MNQNARSHPFFLLSAQAATHCGQVHLAYMSSLVGVCISTMQELLVEGPLTNLKPSMIALSQPKRKFDRAAFGVGGVGAGAVGAIGRYHPPEKVGDPIPGSVAAGVSGSAGGSGMMAQGAAGAGKGAPGGAGSYANGSLGAATSGAAIAAPATLAGAAGSFFGNSLGFSPFAGPSYAIPAMPGADGKGTKGSRAGLGGSSRSISSQLGPATQQDVAGLGGSQSSIGLGAFGSLGSMLTQGSGAYSQLRGTTPLANSGLGLSAVGDMPFSQASFGYAAVGDDPLLGDGILTQGTGLSQAGFSDFLAAVDSDSKRGS